MPESVADLDSVEKTLNMELNRLSAQIYKLKAAGVTALKSLDEDLTFETLLEAAEEDWSAYQRLWNELGSLQIKVGQPFPDKQDQDHIDGTRNILLEGRTIMKRIDRLRRPQAATSAASDSTVTLLNSSAASCRAHLSKIPMPQFCGNLEKWTFFRDTFKSLVHNAPGLSNVEKFHYLIGSLKGEAAALISGFTIEDSSYEQAWDKLIKTYDSPRVLANYLVSRVLNCNLHNLRSETQRLDAFLTEVADSIQSLQALRLADLSEFLLATLALRTLDQETRSNFELTMKSDEKYPTIEDVVSFVRRRRNALRMTQDTTSSSSLNSNIRSGNTNIKRFPKRNSPKYNTFTLQQNSASKASTNSSTSSFTNRVCLGSAEPCLQCKGDHPLTRCSDFHQLPNGKRFELVRSWKVCWNCLRNGHMVSDCPSQFKCRRCQKRHHTLIHLDQKIKRPTKPLPDSIKSLEEQTSPPDSKQEAFTGFGSAPFHTPHLSFVLLGTVRALVGGARGDFHSVRALLDSGSMQSFVTSSLARRIGADVSPYRGTVTSLADSPIPPSNLKGVISCSIRPCDGNEQLLVNPIVVNSIASALPSRDLPSHLIKSLQRECLADFDFGESSPVDMLIGGDLFPAVVTGAPSPSGIDQLYLLPTIFGKVVSGKVEGMSQGSTCSFYADSKMDLDSKLKAFWDLEEPAPVSRIHPDDLHCEEHFLATHRRNSDGRYIVRLPFKIEPTNLGTNRSLVTRRFLSLELKFRKNAEFHKMYQDFMREYSELGHLSIAQIESPYLIPHHGVWREGVSGTKLRVVFDASCPSTSISLNDALYSGPKLQKDLCSILIRFRLHVIPLCADLVKMYRQILVHDEDRRYQHILWRNDPASTLKEYQLNTVTYGVKSSAFQALRVIKQLIHDEGSSYPLAAGRIAEDMYVDDFVSGADSFEEAQQLKSELIEIFAKGGFTLGKWASTDPRLLPDREPCKDKILSPVGEDYVKILGMVWNPRDDSFSYIVKQPPVFHITKRMMLSCIARTFDPLGLLAPVIFTAKHLVQEVWKANIGWDDELPGHLLQQWKELTFNWNSLSSISIPRHIPLREALHQLVGFCDASTKGYAAVLYLRTMDEDGHVNVALIKAKTKVAPLKFLSISRLELCGALLLSRLVSSIPPSLSAGAICFTDSKVALAWINTPAHALKVFEANRVSKILEAVPANRWRHVISECNPSDLASRGCTPLSLKDEQSWWSGPDWLKTPIDHWYQEIPSQITMTNVVTHVESQNYSDDWTSRCSSFLLLIRGIARILRWRNSLINEKSTSVAISAIEFQQAERRIIRFVQRSYLPSELFSNSSLSPKSYSTLAPFVDDEGIVRVGGRLENSPLDYSSKHPFLLPPKAHFSRLIVDHVHKSNFHAGPTLTLALLRRNYWIPRAAKLIRSCILACIHCRLARAKPVIPFMSSLPKSRFAQGRPFATAGVDYAGPFMIKSSNKRKASVDKAYLCLFVCLSTKALHLELVTSLSTPAFLAALERFIARRGVPNAIWSDHGTNFVGASRFIRDVYKFHREAEASIINRLAPRGIDWKFIPPRAPHFGGLWEAGVKAVKGLLCNSLGKQPLTYEELATALAKIESLLNSRPLCALTEDPNDLEFLTPGHFLVGSSLLSLPEPSSDHPYSCKPRSKWEATQAQIEHIWNRWRRDYLHSLQQRNKWTLKVRDVSVGDLVILIERRCSVGQWPVARVVKTYHGRDGVIRTIDVRTSTGSVFTRAVTSVAPLFPRDDEST